MSSNNLKTAPAHTELPPTTKLRWRCELPRIPLETTAQAELREGFIGQERALRALKMGVELSAPGYNVFVCGLAGTSRGGTIAKMIEDLHPPTKPSLDRCYVNNFKIADRPRLLSLPRGQANAFKKDIQAGIDFLRRRIPQVFEGEPFQRQKGRIVERFAVREKELMDDFTRRIAREQFALGHMQVGRWRSRRFFRARGQMVPIEDISKMVPKESSNRRGRDIEKLRAVPAGVYSCRRDSFRGVAGGLSGTGSGLDTRGWVMRNGRRNIPGPMLQSISKRSGTTCWTISILSRARRRRTGGRGARWTAKPSANRRARSVSVYMA
jgi:hypothetical protein